MQQLVMPEQRVPGRSAVGYRLGTCEKGSNPSIGKESDNAGKLGGLISGKLAKRQPGNLPGMQQVLPAKMGK